MAFGGLKFKHHEEGYILMAIQGPRKDRQAALFNLSRAFAYKLGLKIVVAVATSPITLGTDDCDVMIVDAEQMEVDAKLLTAVLDFFDEPRAVVRPPRSP